MDDRTRTAILFVPGDRVRLITPAPVRDIDGPAVGTVGTIVAREVPATSHRSPIWRVKFDDFSGQFYPESAPGVWFVHSDEIERLARQGG